MGTALWSLSRDRESLDHRERRMPVTSLGAAIAEAVMVALDISVYQLSNLDNPDGRPG